MASFKIIHEKINDYVDEETEKRMIKILESVKLEKLWDKMVFQTGQKKTIHIYLKPNDFYIDRFDIKTMSKKGLTEIFFSEKKIVLGIKN